MSALLAWVAVARAATVSGVVYERGSGAPVPGAFVRAVGGEATTGPKGEFSLELPDGSYSIVFGSPLHLPQERLVEVPLTAPLVVYLTYEPPPEIVVEARRESPHVARQVLDRERVQKVPGTHDDPFRLIQALPGVAVTPEYSPSSGDLAIRGSAPRESKTLLDGVEIPYLYHFQQYASVLHTRLLDEVAVYPSTFGAEYGDAVGAVVDASTRPADQARLHGGVNANFVMAGGYVQAPAGERTAFSASGRRSFMDVAGSSSDQYTLWPIFWDYLGRVDHRLGGDSHVSLTAFGAGDRYARYVGDNELLDPLEQSDNLDFSNDRTFHVAIARHVRTLSAGSLDTTAAVVRDELTGELVGAYAERVEDRASLRHKALLWQDGPVGLSTGVDAVAVRLDRFAATGQTWPELEDEAPMLARGELVDETLDRVRLGAWVEPTVELGPVRSQPGARLMWDSASGTVAVDPRLALHSELAPDLRLRGAVGRYSQTPSLDSLSPSTGDPDLGLTTSEQVAAGVDWALAGRWELALDGYAKAIHDAVVEPADEAPYAVEGRAWGVELTSRYRIRDHFFSWASVVVGRAMRDGAPFDYDQPYAFNLVASWDFKPGWNAGVRYRYAAGLPFDLYEAGLYDGDSDTYSPIRGEPNNARLPDYQKIDLRVERTWTFDEWKLLAYGAAWIVPGDGNVLYPVYAYDYSDWTWVAGPSVVPLLGLRAEL